MKKIILNFHNDEDYKRWLAKLDTDKGMFSVTKPEENVTNVEIYSAK